MSEQQAPGADRPRQVTMGVWVSGACSVALLLVVGSVIGRIHTVDFRSGVSSFLDDQRGAGLSMSLGQAMTIIRVGLMLCGAAAAATAVLAFFAARRDRSARIAMSVLALPLLLTGLFVDPFLAGFVVVATVLLWSSPASAWFAGRTPAPAGATGPDPFRATTPAAPATPWSQAPPPTVPAASAAPYPSAYGAHRAPVADTAQRPVRVLLAGLLAGAMSALLAGAMLLTAVVVQTSAGRRDLATVLRDNPSFGQSRLSVDQLATACSVIAVVIAVWSLAAIVLVGFAVARRRWARVALLVSAGAAGLLALGSSLAFPGFLVITAAAVLTGVLLINPDVNAWYAGRPRPSAPAQAQPPTSPW